MGWSGGSGLMGRIIRDLKAEVPSNTQRKLVFLVLIEHFEAEDCDTLDECKGIDPVFDYALQIYYGTQG